VSYVKMAAPKWWKHKKGTYVKIKRLLVFLKKKAKEYKKVGWKYKGT
jgi:hypothetical protein